jgi:hypothetical protein
MKGRNRKKRRKSGIPRKVRKRGGGGRQECRKEKDIERWHGWVKVWPLVDIQVEDFADLIKLPKKFLWLKRKCHQCL